MTQNDLIEIARQAGATEIGHKPPAFHFSLEALETFANLVEDKAIRPWAEQTLKAVRAGVVIEREACAKVCEAYQDPFSGNAMADTIRARGEA